MRYKILRRQMLVVHPDGQHDWRRVDLVYDAENACVGVQLIGDGPLRGTLILVPEVMLAEVKEHGTPSEKLVLTE